MFSWGVLPLVLLFVAPLAAAKTITLDWNVTWVRGAPDGFERPIIGINGEWPCPPIKADVGDIIILTLNNQLGNETTGLHFHGISQLDTPEMDGPSGVTQCPVPPGSSITYNFMADSPGTYWYHSHNMGQYPDGLRGPLIVYDPNDPWADDFDEEVILTVSDWYHEQSIELVKNMLVATNTNFTPPFPNSIIVNDGEDTNITFVPNTTYRLRIINYSAFAAAMLHFDSHNMEVIMTDASYVQEAEASQIRISPGQRYDVLISCTHEDDRNFGYLFSLDTNQDYTAPDPVWSLNYTGQLVMYPNEAFNSDEVALWDPANDLDFLPLDGAAAYAPVNQTIELNFKFCFDENGIPRACFNNQTYITQDVPTLYSVVTTGESNTNPEIYGDVIPFIVTYGEVVEIVVNNLDTGIHPFHLHGHQFQVVERPASDTGVWTEGDDSGRATPMRRDTVHIFPNSYAVLRFQATNPGVFLFHCHIEWHVEMGLVATIIEAPERLRNWSIPADHINNCKLQDIPYAGNAAGNTADVTNSTGFITVPPEVYTGSLYTAPLRPRRIRKTL